MQISHPEKWTRKYLTQRLVEQTLVKEDQGLLPMNVFLKKKIKLKFSGETFSRWFFVLYSPANLNLERWKGFSERGQLWAICDARSRNRIQTTALTLSSSLSSKSLLWKDEQQKYFSQKLHLLTTASWAQNINLLHRKRTKFPWRWLYLLIFLTAL